MCVYVYVQENETCRLKVRVMENILEEFLYSTRTSKQNNG
jgi:hypothetical protein